NNKTICTYDYDKNGTTRHIYEIRGKKKIEHKDNSGDKFVGCVNSLRYDGECYDPETGLFCIQAGSYYDPKKNKIVDDTCYVDMEGLFGDQYERLSRGKSTEADKKEVSPLSLPGTLESQLLYAATKKYDAALSTNVDAYRSNTWYTDFSSPAMHYKLAARIIYAENTNTNNNINMKTYLHYNRQGIAWVIINRLLEDKYRKMKGQACTFSNTSTPNLYSILTKSGAFASLNSRNAKDKITPSANEAYREAFMLACLINVCGSFEEYDTIVPRPLGVTYQCYNKGALNTASKPNSGWSNVRFPGDLAAFTGKSSYAGFTYYSSIGMFNVLHSYKSETLNIQSVYYN
ncbi:hypothetical protein, partial [[Clostridium] polysaccharolyticum]